MSRESSKDTLDTIKEIHKLLDCIELKQVFKYTRNKYSNLFGA